MKIFPDIGLVSLIFIVLNAEWIVILTGAELVVVFEPSTLFSFPWDPDCVAELFITTGVWPGSAVIWSIAPPAGYYVHPETAKKIMAIELITIATRKNE